jgi:hypothetical protein
MSSEPQIPPLKGTGFSPYVNGGKKPWALAPEGGTRKVMKIVVGGMLGSRQPTYDSFSH